MKYTKLNQTIAGSLILVLMNGISFPLISSAMAEDPYDPTDDLMSAFGSKCSSNGSISQTALSQSQALTDIVSSIKNDSACTGVNTGALDNDLKENLASKFGVQVQQQTAQGLQGSIVDVTAAIQDEEAQPNPDSTYIETLQSQLLADQSTLLTVQQGASQQQSELDQARILSISTHGSAVMDSLMASANSTCLNKHPGALAQIGAQVLKVSSGWAPGILGSAMLATGGLIDHFIKAISSAGISQDLQALENGRLKMAIGCAFEGLANTYCQANDLYSIESNNATFADPGGTCSTAEEGTNLLYRDLQSFQSFVNTIYAGSQPASEGTAAEKESVNNLAGALSNLGIGFQGHVAKANQDYNQCAKADQACQARPVRNLIRLIGADVVNNLNNPAKQTTGPIGDSFTDTKCGPTVFLFTSGAQNSCQTTEADNGDYPCESCLARLKKLSDPSLLPMPTISDIQATSAKILAMGNTYVEAQKKIYKTDNPQLSLASSEVYGANNRTAMNFLQDSDAYLNHLLTQNPPGIATGEMLKTIQNAKGDIDKVIKTLASSKTANADPAAINVQLENILAPSTDQNYIPNEIQTIVKQDLDYALHSGAIDKGLAAVLQRSTSDTLSTILNNYGGLEALRNQVRSAKSITKNNLNVVGNLFQTQIQGMLTQLKSDAAKDPADKDLQDDLSLFCMQTLLVPSFTLDSQADKKKKKKGQDPDQSISALCKGQVYASTYKNSGLSLNYDQLSGQPFEKRACSLYDFYRKSEFYGAGQRNLAAPNPPTAKPAK